jgi:hypothetical protein
MKEMPAIRSKDLNDQVMMKIKEINYNMSLKPNLKEYKIKDLNFKANYEAQLPPEAVELERLVESFNKDNSKDKEIEKYKKGAENKIRQIRNLVPDNGKISISQLRMEEFEGDGALQDRRNKSLMRAMNAPNLGSQSIKDEHQIQMLKDQYGKKT